MCVFGGYWAEQVLVRIARWQGAPPPQLASAPTGCGAAHPPRTTPRNRGMPVSGRGVRE
jgi:hypothetical protein